MSRYWPLGLPPYLGCTYITDARTPLNHQSIMNGIAVDIGALQHNINTTHLFASGYLNPILSGFFKNIDTNYLYVNNLYAKSVTLNNILRPNIASLTYTSNMIVADSAFRNNNIQVSDSIKSVNFSLNSSGLIYNPISISGGIHNYLLKQSGDIKVLGSTSNTFQLTSGNITLDNNHKVFIENFGSFAPSGTLQESAIIWDGVAGHNHKSNKINSVDVTDANITYNDDLIISTNQGFIDITSGVLDAKTYELQTFYDNVTFYELGFSSSGIYTCDIPSLSGNVKDLDIGTSQIISYSGRVYATSYTAPSGSKDLTNVYIYSSDDFYHWTGQLVTGSYSPNVSGVSTIDALCINADELNLLLNIKVTSGNYCFAINTRHIDTTEVTYYLGEYAHMSSRYGLGLSSIENNLVVYGYEYPHIYTSGISKWDRDCFLYESGTNGKTISSNSSGQDVSFSGVSYKYSYPFIHVLDGNSWLSDFWLDGTDIGKDPTVENYLNVTDNGVVYSMLPRPDDTFSGYFAGFFGNGFSEITALLSTSFVYNETHGFFTHKLYDAGWQEEELTHPDIAQFNYVSPILVFGNSTTCVQTSSNDTIFGGCVPIKMNIDRRLFSSQFFEFVPLYITSNIADFSPNYLYGSVSILDESMLFRIPSFHYWINGRTCGLINSNMAGEWINNSGRLWSDVSYPNIGRTELINMCPWKPGYLVTPFGGSGEIYYSHDAITKYKLNYTSCLTDSAGLIIPSGTFSDHRNYPTYFDRPNKNGFWTSKTFDWWYQPSVDHSSDPVYFAASGNAPEPPSGAYPKTYYYQRPKCPLQHNGIVYNILEFNTGYVYTGPNGSEYIDDGILYSDLIKYGNTVYGVGVIVDTKNINHTTRLVVTTIKRNVSSIINIPYNLTGTRNTPKFLIHNNVLYIGIGGGRFLAKCPSHTDLCIITNL